MGSTLAFQGVQILTILDADSAPASASAPTVSAATVAASVISLTTLAARERKESKRKRRHHDGRPPLLLVPLPAVADTSDDNAVVPLMSDVSAHAWRRPTVMP